VRERFGIRGHGSESRPTYRELEAGETDPRLRDMGPDLRAIGTDSERETPQPVDTFSEELFVGDQSVLRLRG
jgi:hypothetical protein